MACKSCKNDAGVSGMDDIPTIEIASAIAAAIATNQIDKAVSLDENGTPKDNFFAKNPMAKNAAYVAAGIFLTTMEGEIYKGAGVGMATYGGYNIVNGFLEKPAASGIYGSQSTFIPPQHISGTFGPSSSSAYGIIPSILGNQYQTRYKIPKQHPAKKEQSQPEKKDNNPMYARAL